MFEDVKCFQLRSQCFCCIIGDSAAHASRGPFLSVEWKDLTRGLARVAPLNALCMRPKGAARRPERGRHDLRRP